MGLHRSILAPRVFAKRVGFCALLASVASPVWSLGLGALNHHSRLGQPLDATIEIVLGKEDLGPDQIRAKQLTSAQASELGIELVSSFQKYKLKPQFRNDQLIISVSSDRDIKEPFINLLVELSWPDGRVYREYTLFLDPPGVAAPTASASAATAQTSSASKPQAVMDIPASDENYRVQPGDSLSKIAQRLTRSTGQRRQDLMNWLHAENPSAFIRGDKNRIKAGAKLVLPQGSDLSSAAPMASQPVPTRPTINTPSQASSPAAAPVSEAVDEQTRLTLTTERQDTQRIMSSDPNNLNVSQLQARLDAVNELNERLMRDSREMQERLRLVEGSSYMQNLEDLLLLKEKQVAALKQQLEQRGEQPVQAAETSIGIDDRFAPAATEQSEDNSQRITENTAAELAKPDPVAETKTSYLWWWVFIILGFFGLGLFYWMSKDKPEPKSSNEPADDSFNEALTLDELDQLMEKQGGEARPIPLRPEPAKDEAIKQPPVDKPVKAAKPAPKPVNKPEPQVEQDPNKSKREGWRPDQEVLQSIQQKTQGYTPPVYEDSGVVEHHDEIEGLIAEAMSYGKKGYYDTAEALLYAERARNGANTRIDEAIEFLRKKKEDNPWDAR